MSAATDILEELRRRRVAARADGQTIRLKPRARLDDALLVRVKEHKPEIIRALSARPATCASACYEIEPGNWIHRPWDGCTTSLPPVIALPREEDTCWHCAGSGKCNCITCGHMESHAEWAAGPCVPCKVRKREPVQ